MPVLVAIVGMAGALGAAAIANWDKLFSSPVQRDSRPALQQADKLEAEKEFTAPPEKKVDAGRQMEPPASAGKVIRDRLKSGGEGPAMVVIPAGSFRMGDVQGGGEKDELPVRTLRIQKPFAIGQYEVTFEEYDQFARAAGRSLPSDSGWGRGRRPVINVSWQDAVEYAKWLSKQTGKLTAYPPRRSGNMQGEGGKKRPIGGV